jgi:hypothetical protein
LSIEKSRKQKAESKKQKAKDLRFEDLDKSQQLTAIYDNDS